MIELDGQHYPSEVRSSQAVQLETQETPAGSSEFPGLSEEMALGREVLAGEVIGTGFFAADLDALKSGLHAPSKEGETHDGMPADPSGSGAPTAHPSSHTPRLEAENLPLGGTEKKTALALLADLKTDFPMARVLRFVRYPDDKRVVLVFTDGEEELQLQQQYD